MYATHKAFIHAICPVNDVVDYYEVTVESGDVVFVENIEWALKQVRGTKATQESIACQLADLLCCTVRLDGVHGVYRTHVETNPGESPEENEA